MYKALTVIGWILIFIGAALLGLSIGCFIRM